MVRVLAVIVAVAFAAGCGDRAGERLPPAVEAELPTGYGELWGLCPVTDVPQDFYDRERRKARTATEALIREVRARPHALVTLISHDAHSSEVYRDEMTVRELAGEHLDNPGIEGVPCERRLMHELEAAVEGGTAPEVRDEPTYTWDEVIRALRLRKRGAVFDAPHGCGVYEILTTREEVELAGDEVVTSDDRTVGVTGFEPDEPMQARCRAYFERRLNALAARR